MPAFLKSDGPFSMYDHSLKVDGGKAPSNLPTVTDKATSDALRRYEQEIISL
jgi:hypothetical protein